MFELCSFEKLSPSIGLCQYLKPLNFNANNAIFDSNFKLGNTVRKLRIFFKVKDGA